MLVPVPFYLMRLLTLTCSRSQFAKQMRSFLTELDIEWLVADRGAQLSLLR